VRRCFHDSKFRGFDTIPACETRTDRQTDGRTHDASIASRGKKMSLCHSRVLTRVSDKVWSGPCSGIWHGPDFVGDPVAGAVKMSGCVRSVSKFHQADPTDFVGDPGLRQSSRTLSGRH